MIIPHKIKKIRSRNKLKKAIKYRLPLKLTSVDWQKVEKIFSADEKVLPKKLNKTKDNDARAKEILKLLAAGAVIALSFIVPSAPMALAPFLIDPNKYNKKRFNQTIGRLHRQKLIKISEESGQTVVRITEAGRVRALRYKLMEMEIKRPFTWDKKWRIVIFDIPEKHKNMREIFRRHLQVMGFFMLQKSVWVHPYSCFDEIEFLRQIYHVGVNVTYIIADKIESPENLKHFFDL